MDFDQTITEMLKAVAPKMDFDLASSMVCAPHYIKSGNPEVKCKNLDCPAFRMVTETEGCCLYVASTVASRSS